MGAYGGAGVCQWGEWLIELDLSYELYQITLDYKLGTVDRSLWSTFLILTVPSIQVVPIWKIPLPVVHPPIEFEVKFSLPVQGWLGIVTALSREGTLQAEANTWTLPPIQIQSTLPDTERVVCSNSEEIIPCPRPDERFYGQDASYVSNPESYSTLADGAVRDNVTGLLWQEPHYESTLNWYEAISYCEELELVGFTDWRLPNIQEFHELKSYNRKIPTLDPDYFPVLPYWGWFWTTSTWVGAPDNAWCFDSWGGGLLRKIKIEESGYVRCVRGEERVPRLIDNGDGTISDQTSGLMWQHREDETNRNWENALLYCENLELSGYDNWRLPDIKELFTIADFRYHPAIDPEFFPGIPGPSQAIYFSSTTNGYDEYEPLKRVYLLELWGGTIAELEKTERINNSPLCVR